MTTRPHSSLTALVLRSVRSLVIGLCLSASILQVDTAAFGQTREPGNSASGSSAPANLLAAMQDDATLHDVCFVDSEHGWAVGDQGAIWQTSDRGQTWRLVPSPFDCTFRSVCFLSERVGWIAGGTTVPFARVGSGVVLATTDGGRTWTDLARGRLPQIHSVRFFTQLVGVLVGEATADFSTGVLVTHDGGKSWKAVEGDRHSGWRAAAFVAPEIGIAAGLNGMVARVDGTMSNSRAGGFGARALRDVKLSGDVGWTVGDGGLVLRTQNRGVAWQAPPTPLPEESAQIFDFKAVAVRGDQLWIAGSPGSVVWHSPDGGSTWSPQRSGQTAPIQRMTFQSDTLGWAVGAFGTILRTENGGTTWQAVRAGNRRAAILAMPARPDAISFNVLAKEAGELGYRSVVLLPYRGQGDGDAELDPDLDVRLNDAVLAAGGSQSGIGWEFPLEVPGLDRDAPRLLAEWNRRTEGKFVRTFHNNLVCQIRTWRPTVVLIEQPPINDAAGNLLARTVVEAVREASDPAIFPAHQEIAGLDPWETARVFVRLPGESEGDFRLSVQECLARRKSTVYSVANAASSRLRPVAADSPETEAFRLVYSARRGSANRRDTESVRDFFGGMSIGEGTDARRSLPALDAEVAEEARRAAERDRNNRAIVRRQVDSPTHGAEMIAMLDTLTRGDDKHAAALQLSVLADSYRRRAQWDLAERTLLELVRQFPREPAAFDAMQWLLQFWTGAEPTYQRLRQIQVKDVRLRVDPRGVEEIIDQAITLAKTDPDKRDPIVTLRAPDTLRRSERGGNLRMPSGDFVDLNLRQQRESALQMAALIRHRSPALYRSAEIQLPLAALLRQTGLRSLPGEKPNDAGTVVGASSAGAPSAGIVPATYVTVDQREQKTVKCYLTQSRPYLDGLFSDPCWQDAEEIALSANRVPPAGASAHALVMLTYDARNLYFALSVPRVRGLPTDGPRTFGRRHDDDLSRFDRIALCFDVDRDFTTWYTVEIDQRGCVRESCWGDPNWNPRMGIVATAEGDRWRVEGAIPFSEMVPSPPQPGQSWGLAVIRTIPAVGLESWNPPAASRPRPESFGILRFQ